MEPPREASDGREPRLRRQNARTGLRRHARGAHQQDLSVRLRAGWARPRSAAYDRCVPVNFELRDRVAVITFDDGKVNAFGHTAIDEMHAALDEAASQQAGAILLCGRPGRFSAGFDLAAMTASAESMRALVKAGGRLVARLLLEPRPVVAACTGHALAAGALVLLAADHRIAADGEWKIGLNEVAIGMALPRWAVELARHRLAPPRFEWHVVLGQTSGPAEAVEVGFLDRLVAPESLLDEAFAAASGLAALDSDAVGGTKRRARGALVERMLDGVDDDLSRLGVPRPT